MTTDLEKAFDSIRDSNPSVSVYTNEFDLSMFRVFFPATESKMGYIPDSIAFTNTLDKSIVSNHKIVISRQKDSISTVEKVATFEKITVYRCIEGESDEQSESEESESDEQSEDEEESESSESESESDEQSEDEEVKNNSIVPCSYICDLLPKSDKLEKDKLRMTSIGQYSVTSAVYNKQISDEIKKRVKNIDTLMDCTACVGGDSIGFALNLGCNIISLEKNPLNFKVLKGNIDAYNLQDSIATINGDFTEIGMDIIRDNIRTDVVYFDPPWGGKDYTKHKKLDLFLSGENIKEIVVSILSEFKKVKMVIVKVPFNYNYTDIEIPYEKIRMKKFDVVFFGRNK